MRFFVFCFYLVCSLLLGSCMKWDYAPAEELESAGHGLFVVCEGNFQYGNASLSYYNPATQEVENEVFYRANGMKLGDVAQSMTVVGSTGWIAVNNSHVVFAIDTHTFCEKGRIENAGQPRYILPVNDRKLYISQIWDNRILVADPVTFAVTGSIEVPDMEGISGSTEQMVRIGRFVYCNCWSYQDRIIKIDTETDRVVASLKVGSQPNSITTDNLGRLWTITDGGSAFGAESSEGASLICINPETMTVVRRFSFPSGSIPSELQADGSGSMLYWIDGAIWRMGATDDTLPSTPVIPSRSTIYYGLGIDPAGGDIYVADAIDYQQPGKIYRHDSDGVLIDEFYTGVTPGAFCFF